MALLPLAAGGSPEPRTEQTHVGVCTDVACTDVPTNPHVSVTPGPPFAPRRTGRAGHRPHPVPLKFIFGPQAPGQPAGQELSGLGRPAGGKQGLCHWESAMAVRRRGLEIKLDNASRYVQLPAGPRGPQTRSRREAAFVGAGRAGPCPGFGKDGQRAGCWGGRRGQLRFRRPPCGSGHAEVFAGGWPTRWSPFES